MKQAQNGNIKVTWIRFRPYITSGLLFLSSYISYYFLIFPVSITQGPIFSPPEAMTSFMKVNGPMMIAGKPVSDRFPAMAHGEIQKPINRVTVLEEIVVYKNRRNQRFPENALMEVDGVLTVKNGIRIITAKSLRMLVILFHDAYFFGASILHVASHM